MADFGEKYIKEILSPPLSIKNSQRNNLNCPCLMAALLYREEASVAHLEAREEKLESVPLGIF